MATFDKEGRYGADTMPRDSQAMSGATMQIDPATVKGLEGFQPGDTVDLKVKIRMGEAGEGGPADVEVISVMAEPMEHGAMMRRKETSKAERIPPPMDEEQY